MGDPTERIWQGGSLGQKLGEAEGNGSGVRLFGSMLVLIFLGSVNLSKLNSLRLSFLTEIIHSDNNSLLEQCLVHSLLSAFQSYIFLIRTCSGQFCWQRSTPR